jgi:hypothetical protein
LEWSAFLEMEFFSFQVFGVSNFTSRSFAFGDVISVLFIYLAGLFGECVQYIMIMISRKSISTLFQFHSEDSSTATLILLYVPKVAKS